MCWDSVLVLRNNSPSQDYEQLRFSIDVKTILILSLAFLNLPVKVNVPTV